MLFPQQRLMDVGLLNSRSEKMSLDDKLSIVDIKKRATTKGGCTTWKWRCSGRRRRVAFGSLAATVEFEWCSPRCLSGLGPSQ